MVDFVCVGLRVNGYFVCMGLCGKILRSVVGAVPMCPPVSPHKGASVVHSLAHDACVFIMETPLRGRSGGHTGAAPTISFGWVMMWAKESTTPKGVASSLTLLPRVGCVALANLALSRVKPRCGRAHRVVVHA